MLLRISPCANFSKRAFQISAKLLDKPKAFSPCEKTFIMVKPDGVQRCHIGRIISRFETRGFQLVAMKMILASEELVKKHYQELADKKFFPELVAYIRSGPVVPMVWQGKNIVEISRMMIGKTNPMASNPGTIRGDFGLELDRNIIHGSSDIESAKKEINTWFPPEEIMEHNMTHDIWVYSESQA